VAAWAFRLRDLRPRDPMNFATDLEYWDELFAQMTGIRAAGTSKASPGVRLKGQAPVLEPTHFPADTRIKENGPLSCKLQDSMLGTV